MRQKVQIIAAIAVVMAFSFIFTSLSFGAPPSQEEIKEQRSEIRQMAKETLSRLYNLNPSARKEISKAAGYAVFSNFGMKILVAGSGTGKGIVIDKRSKAETFMKMIELQAGLGFGVKKFKLVWVFENSKDLRDFIDSGWELGSQTTVAAKTEKRGGAFAGAVQIRPGIWIYQMTDKGLALELTAKGTKYYKNDDLN